MTLVRKFFKTFVWPVYDFLCRQFFRPSVRYSGYFSAFRDIVELSAREEMIKRAMAFIYFNNRLPGDYLEFGVWKGGTFTSAFYFAKRYPLPDMRFYAFDSFEGLPEITGVDAEGFKHFEQGQFTCSEKQFRENIIKNGVDIKRVDTVPGWFDTVLNAETKKRLPIERAAVVWIDCDIYESTVPVLEFITSYLQDGTIIIFDDWFCYKGNPHRGEQRAFREWLERHPTIHASEFYKFGWGGNSFIIHTSATGVEMR